MFRPAVVLTILFATATLAACGGSSAQVRTAREARYSASADEVWTGVLAAVESMYTIAASDAESHMLRTETLFFERDGSHEDRNSDDKFMVRDGTVLLAFDVTLKGVEGQWFVDVQPVAAEIVEGSPQPRVIAPGDAAMPGWVEGKIDGLYVAIHDKLQAHAIVTTPAAQ